MAKDALARMSQDDFRPPRQEEVEGDLGPAMRDEINTSGCSYLGRYITARINTTLIKVCRGARSLFPRCAL